MAPGVVGTMSPHGCHRLIRNKYLATAFDHDLSTTAEAALLVICIDSFLRDPKGLTCITLHLFTNFNEVFTSDTADRQARTLLSGIQETDR